MELPKFLIADNSSFKDDLFIVHTEYPRFILNVSNDEVHWLEEFDKEDHNHNKMICPTVVQEDKSFLKKCCPVLCFFFPML